MIVDTPSTLTPVGSQIWIDKSSMTMFSMDVKIRELNVSQTLTVHWRLATKDDPNPRFTSVVLKPQGDMVLRDFPFTVQTDPLHEHECAQLQLAVSGSFFPNREDPKYFDIPNDDDDSDIAEATWLVLEGKGQAMTSDADKAHLLSSCATVEALLMQQAMPTTMDMETPP